METQKRNALILLPTRLPNLTDTYCNPDISGATTPILNGFAIVGLEVKTFMGEPPELSKMHAGHVGIRVVIG